MRDFLGAGMQLQNGDALIVVDVQRDFLPGGRLAVPHAQEIIPVLNDYLRCFGDAGRPIVATRDWHPSRHCSFAAQGGPWPPHCVQDSRGASFPGQLELPANAAIISKATEIDVEAHSGFDGTTLESYLREAGVGRVFVGGLATDYCIRATVQDAARLGFEVLVLCDAIRAINAEAGDEDKALEAMHEAGATLIDRSELDALVGNLRSCRDELAWLSELDSPLLTDLYQLTMIQAYIEHDMHAEAVFEFFVRKVPKHRNFLLAAGLGQLLDFLETLRFSKTELDWLKSSGHIDDRLARYLREFRFTGDVFAVPEGTVVFGDEPIVRVVAPLPQAQLIESRLVNLLNFQTIIASKAARSVLAAPDRLLVDFGMRRAHGAEAALLAARAAYVAGFDGTATLLAARLFEIPVYGTMAHSFVQAHDSEKDAFTHFARSQTDNVVLLIDTYDTVRGAHKVVELVPQLGKSGIKVRAVRLDSGDLIALSREVRGVLDEGGASDVSIFASGGLNEYELQRISQASAPIDGFGIGTDLDASCDAPSMDCAYKLQEYDGRARRKRSAGKATWPGRKQVFRTYLANGTLAGDTVGLESESNFEEPLLSCVMRNGHRLQAPESLAKIRRRAKASLARLPASVRSLSESAEYPVVISSAVRALAAEVDAGTR